jgi:hypothetical protein
MYYSDHCHCNYQDRFLQSTQTAEERMLEDFPAHGKMSETPTKIQKIYQPTI